MGDATEVKTRAAPGGLQELMTLVDSSEIIDSSSPVYLNNTQPWSSSKDKKPRLVLRPRSIASLSGIIAYLSTTTLEYKVRSQGFGSASASDVLISLTAFDDFEFNEKEEYVVLGAGGDWKGYYERMEKVTKQWTIVPIRTPSIGIGGSTLCSGFSWLSSEYGCASDPANLLDIRVVTADGKVFWAAEGDPDLLWAMRGTEGGFAIATHFKFRARRFPENGNLWGGPILIPRNKVQQVAEGILSMTSKDERGKFSEKCALFLYVMRKELLEFIGASMDMLVVHGFDARGEKAGREEFAWALSIDGVIDQTRSDMTLGDQARLQEHIGALRGTREVYFSPICLVGQHKITNEVITKSFDWWTSMLSEPNSVAENGYLLFELFSCRDSLTGRHSSAWPRPEGYKHMLLLGAGCTPGSDELLSTKAKQYLIEAPMRIFGTTMDEVAVVPNAVEEFHDVERMYGDHFSKLREIKTRVDPSDKVQGKIRPLPL